MTLGVIVGRFQVPMLTEAHKKLFALGAMFADQLLVVVGSSQEHGTFRNPLPEDYRIKLVSDYIGVNHTVIGMRDDPSDKKWVEALNSVIKNAGANKIICIGGPDSFINVHKLYSTLPNCTYLIAPESDEHGTAIRRDIGISGITTALTARGAVWATQNQGIRLAVDIMCTNGHCVLLGQKAGETGWRLPGGFVEASDDSTLSAAKREFGEETNWVETDQWKLVDTVKISDPRFPSTAIFSHLYQCAYHFGFSKPSDDLVKLAWFARADLPMTEAHKVYIPYIEKALSV